MTTANDNDATEVTAHGDSVTEITVHGNVVWTAGPDIPDTGLLHYHPGDEGSGSTLNDNEGNADISLHGPSWSSVPGFTGDYGLFFDGSDDYAEVTIDQPSARTRFIRLKYTNVDTSHSWAHHRIFGATDNYPMLAYHDSGERWDYRDARGNSSDLEVDDPISDIENEDRILVTRMDSSDKRLDVYDGDKNHIGGGHQSNPDNSYSGSTTYIGSDHNQTRHFGEGYMDPMFLTYDHYKTDTEVQDVLEAF